MAKKREYRRVSKRAKALLARSEGTDVDFKRAVKAVHAEDLVAFANAPTGGAILVGVDEASEESGTQRGKIVGCGVGDSERLMIINKAQQCMPPVQVELFTENLASLPFLRVEIRTSEVRPHATSNGTYKIRSEGRNAVLDPTTFAQILLEREAKIFNRRFEQAAASLRASLAEVDGELEGLSSALDGISGEVGVAASEAGDAAWTLSSLESDVDGIRRTTSDTAGSIVDLQARLAALLKHQGVADPVAERAAAELRRELGLHLRKNPEVVKSFMAGLTVTITSRHARKLPSDRVQSIVTDACREILKDAEPTDDS